MELWLSYGVYIAIAAVFIVLAFGVVNLVRTDATRPFPFQQADAPPRPRAVYRHHPACRPWRGCRRLPPLTVAATPRGPLPVRVSGERVVYAHVG